MEEEKLAKEVFGIMREPTLLSLFDGSGGFPLAGFMCGITPVAASEVEPYPISVTRSRFPHMKHLGDISKINGTEIEPVDVITFGSPCQDLSVAGKRAGLKHEDNGDDETTRSGLFMEAVRIIKEMREATNGEYPRFAVWENVPGAFSSNKGEDFRIVLEELIKVAEPAAVMPAVPKNGWAYADVYCGDGWSLAYRVFDAQYWGVPQRRRRIYLVADFGGQRAGKVLFEREGLRGHFETGRTPWQSITRDAESGIGAANREGNGLIAVATQQGGAEVSENGICPTITAAAGMSGNNQPWICQKEQFLFENHSQDTRYKGPLDVCPMLPAQLGTGGNNTPFVVEKSEPVYCLQGSGSLPSHKGDGYSDSDTMHTLNTIERHAVAYWDGGQIAGTLTANNANGAQRMPDKDNFNCVIAIDRAFFNQGQNALYDPQLYEDGTNPTLVARGPNAVAVRCIVRRLTPTECARLQGFPDKWGHPDIKAELTDEEYGFWLDVRNTHAAINGRATKEYTKEQILKWYNGLHTDSAEYKLWGNGIALPNALYVMQGIADIFKS